jgi:hypothetical protein
MGDSLMGNKVTVGTDICGDLAPLVPTSLDCSMCTIGFPQFGGRVGISFYTNNFCPTTALEPSPSIWLNGMYPSFAQLRCKQPGVNAEPDPGLFIGEGYFSSIDYTNPQTGRSAAHQFKWRVEMRPTDHFNVDIALDVYVLGPGAVWHTYAHAGFGATEILGPNDNVNLPYRTRRFIPQTGTAFTNWKGETTAYPPAASPAKGDVYTTQWSVAGGGNLPSPPFPAGTPAGMAFVWNGTSWATAGYATRWDYEGVRASDGQSYSTRRFIPIATSSTYAGVGDGIWWLSMIIGTESLREGCGGGGNAFPVCGMWSPLTGDSQGAAWHTCFRAFLHPTAESSEKIYPMQLGIDQTDCGKRFLVDDGTVQYGPFCGCDKVVRKPWGWESLKNNDIPCYYPEVVSIGVPGEATGQLQEIQTNGTGNIVIKQIDGGPLYACHGIATGVGANGCSTMNWEIVQVQEVMRTGSPYIYRVVFPTHGVTMYLHSLRFPSDPIMPDACTQVSQMMPPAAAETPVQALAGQMLEEKPPARDEMIERLKNPCQHRGGRLALTGYG